MKADIERLANAFMDGAAPKARATFDSAYAPLNVFAGVRAILQALREPSEGMIGAGWKAGAYKVTGGTIYSEYSSDPPELGGDAPEAIWKAMIDDLLSEDP